jgi:phosphopantothenoylcysteine decarboxylase/phosphopantothenate--cysteine ligase
VRLLWPRRDLAGDHVLVTAGPTREALDPVRYLSNRSSGKMGFALAEAARDRGAAVTLVCGPVALPTPYGVERIDVTTTAEMAEALRCATRDCDAVIMAAAPADFRAARPVDQKIKREDASISVDLEPNADIIAGLSGPFVKVGFAAETHDMLTHARDKVARKGLDLIAANDVTADDAGFATDTNRITLVDASGATEELPLLSKYEAAHQILHRVLALLRAKNPSAAH